MSQQRTADLFDEEKPHSGRDLAVDRFPKTRFQGSKRKLLRELADCFSYHSRGTAIDLYSGSGIVSLLLRSLGFQVIANDYLRFANNTAQVFLEATSAKLDSVNWTSKLRYLLEDAPLISIPVVHTEFAGIFFTADENLQIDRFCQNVDNEPLFVRAVLTYAVGQALLMKRPYNLFHRANLYMRLQDVKRSFGNAATWAKPILYHAARAIDELKQVPWAKQLRGHVTTNCNTHDLSELSRYSPDVIYADPPYIASGGKAIDYADFYHFLEGLLDYSLFTDPNRECAHKPIVRTTTNWSSHGLAIDELVAISQT